MDGVMDGVVFERIDTMVMNSFYKRYRVSFLAAISFYFISTLGSLL